MHNNYSLL